MFVSTWPIWKTTQLRISFFKSAFMDSISEYIDAQFIWEYQENREKLFLVFSFFPLQLIYRRSLEFRINIFSPVNKKINKYIKILISFADKPIHYFLTCFWHIFWPCDAWVVSYVKNNYISKNLYAKADVQKVFFNFPNFSTKFQVACVKICQNMTTPTLTVS